MTLILNAGRRFRPETDEEKVKAGYSLILADISFYHPETTWLICGNTFTQQLYDLVPDLPELNDLLRQWTSVGVRIETVKVACHRGIARIEAIDGHFKLH